MSIKSTKKQSKNLFQIFKTFKRQTSMVRLNNIDMPMIKYVDTFTGMSYSSFLSK